MKQGEYKEKVVYIRKKGELWEAMGGARGQGFVLENLPTRHAAITAMTAMIWAYDTHGPEKYGSVLGEMEDVKAPEGIEYPVIEE